MAAAQNDKTVKTVMAVGKGRENFVRGWYASVLPNENE